MLELLNPSLPVWTSDIEGANGESRLDNNWYSPAAVLAERQMKTAERTGRFRIISIANLCEDNGIDTGVSPTADGTIGVIEGRNLKPNFIVPLFTKHSDEATELCAGDILVGKDGEPGTVSVVTESLLGYCGSVAVGCHVYHLKIQDRYRPLSPFVSAFLNSRTGQALLRKNIAGGTTPTIRSDELAAMKVIIPSDELCPKVILTAVLETQDAVITSMQNLEASRLAVEFTGVGETEVRLPTNWAGGGAQRSSRILS